MLEAVSLGKNFRNGSRRKPAITVQNVCLQVKRGEAIGLLGPSGSGKSTIARMLAGLIRPSTGSVRIDDLDLGGPGFKNMTHTRKMKFQTKIQMIFQDPVHALDPKKTIGWSMREPLLAHGIATSRPKADQMVCRLFSETGLSPGISRRYPCEISGGQAQRVVIARALGLSPAFLIADEPTSMLDLSVQAMILGLLKTLQQQRNLGIVLISHDSGVIRRFCDRILHVDNKTVSEIRAFQPDLNGMETTPEQNRWIYS